MGKDTMRDQLRKSMAEISVYKCVKKKIRKLKNSSGKGMLWYENGNTNCCGWIQKLEKLEKGFLTTGESEHEQFSHLRWSLLEKLIWHGGGKWA